MRCMRKNKKIFYDIFSEFNQINKYRELKSIVHHGTNRLDHITRVSKVSFFISKKLGLDYISCTRGAMMHDFFTEDDMKRSDDKYKVFLKTHPMVALDNSKNYFKINNIEEDIILNHMYPISRNKPCYKESKIVCISDKLVSFYEFFRYSLKLEVYMLLFSFINLR